MQFDGIANKHVLVKVPDLPLNYVSGTIYGNYGPVSLSWQKNTQGQIHDLYLKIPFNTAATVVLPHNLHLTKAAGDGRNLSEEPNGDINNYQVGSGNWHFEIIKD